MAKHRSPNCPQITFREAIEKGRKVYEKEHVHPTAKEVVAQDLGYSGINGRSLSLIGALRQYGILEGTGEALRVSQDAVSYFERDEGPEKDAATQRMIFAPTLFGELREQFPDKLPSEGNLRHTLVTKGFLPKAAEDVIRVYRANTELATSEEKGYDDGDGEGHQELNRMEQGIQTVQQGAARGATIALHNYSFPLSPDTRAELSLKGTITDEDLDLLRDHIELTIKALKRVTRAKE